MVEGEELREEQTHAEGAVADEAVHGQRDQVAARARPDERHPPERGALHDRWYERPPRGRPRAPPRPRWSVGPRRGPPPGGSIATVGETTCAGSPSRSTKEVLSGSWRAAIASTARISLCTSRSPSSRAAPRSWIAGVGPWIRASGHFVSCSSESGAYVSSTIAHALLSVDVGAPLRLHARAFGAGPRAAFTRAACAVPGSLSTTPSLPARGLPRLSDALGARAFPSRARDPSRGRSWCTPATSPGREVSTSMPPPARRFISLQN